MELMSNEISVGFDKLIGKCFEINRIADRGVSILENDFKMIQCAKYLHENFAHKFLGEEFADGITAYKHKRSKSAKYPTTIAGDFECNKPIEIFNKMLNSVIEFQDDLYDMYDITKEQGDLSSKKFINSLINNLVNYVDMIVTTIDILSNYSDDKMGYALFDANYDEYFD